MRRKGIILADGAGNRLHPLTLAVSKQLLPVYDKPMIYYPLSVVMLAGIRDFLIITTPENQGAFQRELGDGERFGIRLEYAVQPRPEGLAQAFLIGEDFIGDAPCCPVLGDNIFFGQGLTSLFQQATAQIPGAIVFGYRVSDPERFGVVAFDDQARAVSIEEEPEQPKSHYAVTGLYFYDNDVVDIARRSQPSDRGELEITAVNEVYIDRGDLHVQLLGRGFAWLDTGAHESLLEAAHYVEAIEKRQGQKIACLEKIAWRKGWSDEASIEVAAHVFSKSNYGDYLQQFLVTESVADRMVC